MGAKQVKFIRPQTEFRKLAQPIRAYVAGYRAGKTWVGSSNLCESAYRYPRVDLGYYAPTYPLIRDIFYPTIERVAYEWGLSTDIKEGNKEVFLYSGRQYLAMIRCRSMEKPQTLIGYQHGRCLVDEIDTMPKLKADQAWSKIVSRNSVVFDDVNRIDVTTTPEGFQFTYHRFVKMVRDNPELGSLYGLIQASTYENEVHLPDGYIDSLLKTYASTQIQAYLGGKFVNLTHGTVYNEFDRNKNKSDATILPGEPLFIGMDFNVGKMAAITHVKRDGQPHAVDEFINQFDTPKMIKSIKERYWKYEDGDYRQTHQIRVYPDSSGGSRKSVNASETDIQLLKNAGFKVSAPPANPPVKDRVNSMNAMFCNAIGERRYRVNPDKCPTLVECYEQQAYNDAGEPDKSNDLDHPPDAAGYFIHRDYPLRRPDVDKVTKLRVGM